MGSILAVFELCAKCGRIDISYFCGPEVTLFGTSLVLIKRCFEMKNVGHGKASSPFSASELQSFLGRRVRGRNNHM